MYKKHIKRCLDIIVSLILMPVLLIVTIIVSVLIYLEDKGSPFYNSERLGKNGRLFKMYKFRSMKENSKDIRNKDGSTFNSNDDYRLTKVGKIIRRTSIDELPQLLNVFIGDMSIIGPRPTVLTTNFDDLKGDRKKRYNEKPGITGYTQAYFRNSISQGEKFKYDVYYIENVSFKMDLKILIKTVETVLFKKNIYINSDIRSDERER